ncbi:MAG: cysteine desulfurase family protein [Nanoarchaeota archaeon]
MGELYFDSNSTTRVHPEVVRVMNDVMLKDYGNPSSLHALGDRASKILESARLNVSKAIGAKYDEIYFTSGATESNNLAIIGLASAFPEKRRILISSIEHPSIREVCKHLKSKDYEIVEIPVDKDGFVNLKFIENNLNKNTLIVSVIHGQNIFGTLQNLKKIGDICKAKKVLFHTDASQSFGKTKILVHDWNLDMLSASAHKISGPKGVGVLYIDNKLKINPLFYGGGQERGLRSGTENVPGIAGLDKAVQIAIKEDWKKISKMRDYLIENLAKMGAELIGSRNERVLNNIFVYFSGLDSERLLYDLSAKKIYISVGSACDSKKKLEDASLLALGLSKEKLNSVIRISLPVDVKKKDVDYFVEVLKRLMSKCLLKEHFEHPKVQTKLKNFLMNRFKS